MIATLNLSQGCNVDANECKVNADHSNDIVSHHHLSVKGGVGELGLEYLLVVEEGVK